MSGEEFFTHKFENGEIWVIPQNKKRAFEKWLENDKNGLIDKIAKLTNYKNLNEIYLKSNIAKKIKAKYNQMNEKRGKKYNIKMFYKLLKSLVQIEMINDETGKIIKRVGSKTNLKKISIKVVSKCFISGITIIKKAIKKVKKWLDSFREIEIPNINDHTNVFSHFSDNFKGYNSINTLTNN